jgi:hypothetical protein
MIIYPSKEQLMLSYGAACIVRLNLVINSLIWSVILASRVCDKSLFDSRTFDSHVSGIQVIVLNSTGLTSNTRFDLKWWHFEWPLL